MRATSVVLVLLVSALGATAASGVQWKPRVEYEFELNGRSLAGLPTLQGQYSGVLYGGRVRVQGLTTDTAIVRLEKMWWSSMHARLQSGWWSVQPQGDDVLPGQHESRPLRLSGTSAVARFQNGKVLQVLVGGSVPDWEVNLLQGVLAHLQMQTASSSSSANNVFGQRSSSSSSDRQTESGVFRVLEDGLSGRCEVLYEVAPAKAPVQMSAAETKLCAGKPYVQVTKTKNFTDCDQYAEQTRGLPRCSPAGNACASLWTRNSVAQLIGCGSGADLQLVQSVSVGSMQAELQMREDSRAAVFNSVNMTLSRVQPVRERLPAPKDGVMLKGLGYRVAGKQMNINLSPADVSNEDSESEESVEVIGKKQQQQQQHSDESSSEPSSNEHHESKQKNASSSHKKVQKSGRNNSRSSSEDSNEDSVSSHKKAHKSDRNNNNNNNNNNNSNSEEDSSVSSHKKAHKSDRKNSNNNSNSEEDSSASHHQKSGHRHGKKASDENNRSQNNNSNSHESHEQDSSSSKQHKKKSSNNNNNNNRNEEHKGRSRKSRSAKDSDSQEDTSMDDVFAGALSPAQVRRNSTLRAALQKRLSQEVKMASSELSQRQGPTGRTMERISMAIRLSRALDSRQLRSVKDQLSAEQRDLYHDVLAMCGSEACVEETVTLIKQRGMSSMAAQMALSALPDRVSQPSRAVLKQLQDLYKSSDNQQVKAAAVLALGEIAGRSPRSLAGPAASFLAERLEEQRGAAPLRTPLAFALGSTGTSRALQTLVKMAKSSSNTPYHRAQAILALKRCGMRAPMARQVRDVLLALYHGPTSPAPVRMAAVSLLAYSRPGLAVWQRLAVSTHYERNLAVSAYVWSTIRSFAELQDPAFSEQTRFARLSLPLARRLPQGTHLAFNMLSSSVDAHLDRMVHEHAAFMTPADAASVYYRRVVREAGVSSLDKEADLWGANPDDLMVAVMEAAFGRQDKTKERPAARNVPHSTRTIHEKLSIVRRRLQDPQGHLRLTLRPFINNMFLTFDKDTPSNIAKAASKYVQELRSGSHFQAQKLGGEEMSVSTVNDMGFAVNLRLQAPWLLRASGTAQLHRNHSAEANITCLYTSGLHAQLSVQPSWMSREYLAGVHGHALLQLPSTTLRAEMNATDGRVSVSAEPQSWTGEGSGAALLARAAVQPVTSSLELSQDELASTSPAAHNASRRAPQQQVELSPWEEVSLSLRAAVKRDALPAWLRASRTVLGVPILGTPLTASRLELFSAQPRAVNASFSLVKAMMQRGDLQVVFPASLRRETDPRQPDDSPATTTAAPATTTEEPATTTESAAATTTAAPAVRAPRSSGLPRNGSVYGDSGAVDFAASVFNATMINPYTNRINGSGELYMLSQVLGGMDGARGYVLGVNITALPQNQKGSAEATSYSGFWSFGSNLGGRLLRAGLFGRNDADNAQVAATAALLRDVPAGTDLGSALHQPPALMVKAEYVQIDAKAVMKVVTAAMETSRSSQKTQRLWQERRELQCSQPRNASVSAACRAVLSAANSPDQYNVTVNYNNAAEDTFGAAVHNALQMAKAYLWNQGKVAVDTLATGHGNELGAGVTVQSDGSLDGWLQTPRTLTEVVAAKLPVSFMSTLSRSTGAYCGVSASRLHTLDDLETDYQLGQCWHLLAKDCSGKSRVAVLARRYPGNASALELEVNVDNYQVALLSPERASLNGAAVNDLASDQLGAAVEVRDAADVRVMRIVRAEDGAMNIELPDHGLSVVYGNSSVLIQAGGSLRGRLCGMCGNFGGSSTYGELNNPKNEAEKNVQAFADSYAIKGSECSKGRQ